MSKKLKESVNDPNLLLQYKGEAQKSSPLSSLYNKYFALVTDPSKSNSEGTSLGCQVSARCCLCPITNYIQFTVGTTSNLRKHLKRKHPFALNEVEEHKALRKMQKAGKLFSYFPAPSINHTNPATETKQAKVTQVSSCSSSLSFVDQLTTFITDTMQPVSIINECSFVNLLQVCSTPFENYPVDVSIIENNISSRFEKMISDVNNELASITYVCITADVWSTKNSVIVVTAHWLNSNLERKSAALACTFIKGLASLEDVAQNVGNIITKFDMHKKESGNLTINITNFTREFNASQQSEEDSGEEVEEHEIASILSNETVNSENELVNLYFPNHHHCLSNLLLIVSSKDIRPALELLLSVKPSSSTFNKLQGFWETLSTGKTEISTDKTIKLPFVSMWNNYYRAAVAVNNLRGEFEKSLLTAEEITFLSEFEQVLKPLIMAVNHLNEDNKIFLAHILPTVNGLKRKLINMKTSVMYCKTLIVTILESIEKRFGDLYRDTSLVVASCTHPKFKMRWIPEADRRFAMSLLEDIIAPYIQNSLQKQSNECVTEMEDLYCLENVSQPKTELERYLEDTRCELGCLDGYPVIKEVFCRYNTTIANRKPVEQLFSGPVMKNTRMSISDSKNFEMQLLLRANKQFSNMCGRT